MEIVGTDPASGQGALSQWFNNAHGSGRGLEVDAVASPAAWHKVGFEWTPSVMRWFYDGALIREQPNYVNKPMYFLASWEVGGKWPGDPNGSTSWPAQIELDYVKYLAAKPGSTEAGAPNGYELAWKDDFNSPSIGVGGGKNWSPYFADWGVRHLAGNEDEAIKVADGETGRSGGSTYGQLLASTGQFGTGPFFHVYTKPGTPQPGPAPVPTPSQGGGTPPPPFAAGKVGAVSIVASGDPDGGGAHGGPFPKLLLLVDGKPVAGPTSVTADHAKGQWQTLTVETGLDLAKARTIGIQFTNDWANWKPGQGVVNGEDRNLWVDKIVVGGKAFEAESGIFRYASGGSAKGGELLASNGTLELDVAGRIGTSGSAAKAGQGRALDPASLLDDTPAIDGPAFRGHGEANEIGASSLPYRPDLEVLLG